jgi:hypothetical protein
MRTFLTLALGAALLSACAASPDTPSATIALDSDALLASRSYDGGLCPDQACSSTFAVTADGSWTATSNGSVVADGSVPTEVLSDLIDATSSTGIPDAPPFTGTCPIAYDGSEVTYAWTTPEGVVQQVSACDKAIPDEDPLVLALDAAEAAWTR